MFYTDISLADLVNLKDWQDIQDYFADAMEVTLVTASKDGNLLCRPSRPSRLCRDILPKIPHKDSICQSCALKDYQSADLSKSSVKCPFGLEIFIAPITAVGEKAVAYIILGPVILKARKTPSEYAEDAKMAGIKPEELIDALIEINVFSYNHIKTIGDLITHIFSYMAQTGYHKKRLGEIAPDVAKMDPLFSRYYEEKIFNSLLNSCMLALDADSGSVMTLDKDTNLLHIKVSSKLDEGIAKNAEIKMGEGIAGVAAATADSIILPKDKNKNHLSEKMKRTYIKSSMIVPFAKGNSDDVYGVINLNVVRRTVDFSDRDISLVKELVRLATIALIPLQNPAKNG